jgi:hypothetical protein
VPDADPATRRGRWRRLLGGGVGPGHQPGPDGWDPADQRLAGVTVLTAKDLGRGWISIPMVNNELRREPFGHDGASQALEAARQRRRPTGLHEGRAFRHRDSGALCVVRSEVFADAAPAVGEDDPVAGHRTAWTTLAEAALDATWRERWRERDRHPAWIEARWVQRPDDPAGPLPNAPGVALDWVRIEDHTPLVEHAHPGGPGEVTVYDYLTVWAGRRQVTVVIRHPLGLDLDDAVAGAARCVGQRLRA